MITSTTTDDIRAWFLGRLPADMTAVAEPQLGIDDDEIVVTIAVAAPELADDADETARAQAAAGRLAGWRQDTREVRIGIAREAQQRFGRTVSWAATVGEQRELFTHIAVPVMTRLRQPERAVLDTLVAAGVAKSRADALRWCVKLTGTHTEEWLAELRSAMAAVHAVREQGPTA